MLKKKIITFQEKCKENMLVGISNNNKQSKAPSPIALSISKLLASAFQDQEYMRFKWIILYASPPTPPGTKKL